MAADQGEIVGEFVPAQDGDAGQENVRSQIIDETGNLKPHLSRLVRDHVKAVVLPLYAGLVLGGRIDLAVPGGSQTIIVGGDGTSGRKPRYGLHYGTRLANVHSP